MRDLRALPKAHLHIHLEATLRPETFAEFSGLPPRTSFEWSGFTEFVNAFFDLVALIDSPARLARMVDEAVADAAADGVVAIELATTTSRYVPMFGSQDAAIEAICAMAAESAARHGVWTGIIVAIDRTAGAGAAREIAEAAARRAGRGVTGLGLHAEERGFPARDFQTAYRIARDAGLLAVPHAGELVGPASVREAVELLRADRVQHGVRSIEDPDLVAELAATGTVLDVCPTSNKLLGVVPSLAEHPLPALLAAGVRCSINADDPTLFGVGILDEYEVARHDLGLTDEAVAGCARTSIGAAAAPAAVKHAALAAIDSWLRQPSLT